MGPQSRTSSSTTARGSTSTSAPTPSTPRPSATTYPGRHARQGGGARPRGPAARRPGAAARRGHRRRRVPVQEQHRLGRELLRVPRELPRRRATASSSASPTSSSRSSSRGRLSRAPARCCTRPAGRCVRMSQRAEHIWEGVSSATTRSRPIINTRDEPHADAEKYRRLHVIVGDSNMSEMTSFLKVGATTILLRMIEENVVMRDMTLENPIRAIREISHDMTCRRKVRLANGRRAQRRAGPVGVLHAGPALVREYRDLPDELKTALEAVGAGPHGARERPVVAGSRARLGDEVQADPGLPRPARPPAGSSARRAVGSRVPRRPSRPRLVLHARARRSRRAHGHRAARRACDRRAPQTTRARLRAEFIKEAKRAAATTPWTGCTSSSTTRLSGRCCARTPSAGEDERVERLIDGM